uniref:Putative reverse transcriptase domain-containing protein n=1 Tax=Tanacetum cinerariifolium TaxID=118510 RepID=A0A699J781_TANCI|nr:putative reverse transcriptase domain-containing protein [Tanacetum cinerariifolium]
MYDEYNALVKNGTWLLVPRAVCVNMVRSMWLFKHKFHADGNLSRYKARLVANGSSQQLGVDFDETFSLIVKPATIHGIILIAFSPDLLQHIIASLHNEFDMTGLGALNCFFGISVDRTSTGDKVMLRVSPWKGVIHFGKRGKLNPRYIGHFKILARVGTVGYRLELPEQLSRVHCTSHVSKLKKCMADEPLAIPLDEIQVDDKLNFIKEPVKIMDREVKRLKQSRILIVKVCWNSRRGPEFTWEREDQMQKKYPHLFSNSAPVADTTS